METTERTKAPGINWVRGKPVWRASRQAIAKGYEPKNVPLAHLAHDEQALIARCVRLQKEMDAWLAGGHANSHDVRYNGTFASLFDYWTNDEDSDYRKLKRQGKRAAHPYDSYIPKLKASIGQLRPDRCDGSDLRRWFKAWRTGPDGEDRLAAARMTLCVVKAAITYGQSLKLRGCADFRSVIDAVKFQGLQSRNALVSTDQVIAARGAAHEIGHPRLALAYAIQFETFLRQFDVAGVWRPLDFPAISSVARDGEKWIGPMWSDVNQDLILTLTPTKTENNRNAPKAIKFDLKACPMIVEELARIPVEERTGPLIIDMRTGQPYSQWLFRDLWRQCADRVGIPAGVQNRDLRASGITEARMAGAPLADASKQAAHRKQQTTATIYERDTLEAHRRNATLRKAFRQG
jgi:hypothetical protein